MSQFTLLFFDKVCRIARLKRKTRENQYIPDCCNRSDFLFLSILRDDL